MNRQKERLLSYLSGTWVVFTLTIVFPSIALSWLGLRIVLQERIVAEEDARGRLTRAADEAARALQGEFALWQAQIDGLSTAAPDLQNLDSFPERIQSLLQIPGAGVLVQIRQDRITAVPATQLLYRAESETARDDAPGVLAAADRMEILDQDYQGALEEYRRLLATNHDPDIRPWIQEGIARVSWKSGRTEDALQAYRALRKTPAVLIRSLPAGLIAGYKECHILRSAGAAEQFEKSALDFYGALIGGEWRLQKERYEFYANEAHAWLNAAAPHDARYLAVMQLEERKKDLTEAVDFLIQSWRANHEFRPAFAVSLPSGPAQHLAFWHPDPSRSAVQVMVISAYHAKEKLFPRVFAQLSSPSVHFRLSGEHGETLYNSQDAETSVERTGWLAGTSSLQARGSTWQIEAWPGTPEIVNRDIRRRQWLYTGMLMLMLVSLLFGIVSRARTVRKQLEIARMKSNFVSAVSHEFRSPLTGIRQLAEMLGSGRVTNEERKAQFYDMIGREAERLTHLVENALGFARATEKTVRYRMERVDTGEWLRELVQHFQQSPAAREFTVISSIPGGLAPILVDHESMSGAIGNLLDNAVKYSPECRTIWFEACQENDQIVIRVRDQGIGIAAEDQKHLFERFFRIQSPLTRKVHGTGLGLSLVQEVVAAHKGQVGFDSRPGEGSTFYIKVRAAL